MRHRFFAFAILAVAAVSAFADATYTVTLNTAPLAASPAGPFSLAFQIADGSGLPDGNNIVEISNFKFGTGGGAPFGSPIRIGRSFGDLSSKVTLTDGAFPNVFVQSFTPGPTLTFTIHLSTNVDDGDVQDEFIVYILDKSFAPVPTQAGAPLDEFLQVRFNSSKPALRAFGSDLTRSPTAGGSPIDFGTSMLVNPLSQTVRAGTSVTFTALAIGSPTPSPRWQLSTDDGMSYNDIPGATSTTFSFTAIPAQDGNRFRAVFTNSGGSVTSNVAVLGVTTGPPAIMNKISGDGRSAPVGQAFVPNLKVVVLDQDGNPVPKKAVTFTVQPGPTGSSGTFAATPTQPILTGPDGTATAPVLTANGIPGTFTVVASDPPPPLSATFTLNILSSLATAAEGAYLVRYLANLDLADSYVDISNTGTVAGNDPAGSICANIYVFDPNEEPVSCCACPVTPNGLVSLSAVNSLILNRLTAAAPSSALVKILFTANLAGATCNAGALPLPLPSGLARGGAAWAVTPHANTFNNQTQYQLTESEFARSELSLSEYQKLVNVCNFIQNFASGFGLCKGCQAGAQGGSSR